MSRKKNAKGAAKRQQNSLVAIKSFEKDFWQTPSKWASQLSKEIKSLKQKEKKLKTALNKNTSQTNTFAKRLQNTPKNTSAGKKQWIVAKRAHSETLKIQSALTKELKEITNSLDATTKAQAKLSALHQNLNQFQKDWAKKSKKTKIKAKTKPRKLVSKPATQKEEPKPESVEITDNFVRYETDVVS